MSVTSKAAGSPRRALLVIAGILLLAALPVVVSALELLSLGVFASVEPVSDHWFVVHANLSPLSESGGSAGTIWRRTPFSTRPIREYTYLAKDLGDDCVLYASTQEHQEDYFCACGNHTPLRFAASTVNEWEVGSDSLTQTFDLVFRDGKLARDIDRIRFDKMKEEAAKTPTTFMPTPSYVVKSITPDEVHAPIDATPAALSGALVEAADHDNVSQMIALLAHGNANPNLGIPPRDDTALMHVLSIEAAKTLLLFGADINQRNSAGDTPVICASRTGKIQLVRYLIDRGADPRATNKAGQSAASRLGAIDRNFFRNGAVPIDAKAEKTAGFDPRTSAACEELIIRAVKNRIDIIGSIIDAGVDPNCRDSAGNTPLVEGARRKMARTTLRFLLDHGSDVNGTDDVGTTPLMAAVEAGARQLVPELLASGANVNATNMWGRTAVDIANEGGNREIIGMLSPAQKH